MEEAKKRIAVVDDDPQLANLIREFLTEEGYDVQLCASGERAFATLQTLLPDLIVLDVRMAGVSGLGILYRLATNEQTHQIPVLLCTAVSSSEMQPWEEVLDQKRVPVLFKPFSLDELATRVAAMLAPAAALGTRALTDAGPGHWAIDDEQPHQR